MNELLAFTTVLDPARGLAHSALPDAPVVPVADTPPTRTRSWTAARLRAFAQATDQLANRVDPVCVS